MLVLIVGNCFLVTHLTTELPTRGTSPILPRLNTWLRKLKEVGRGCREAGRPSPFLVLDWAGGKGRLSLQPISRELRAGLC